LQPGNAAVYYGKVKAEQTAFFAQQDLWKKVEQWSTMPLDELRQSNEAATMIGGRSVFYYLEEAARCETCDWQLPIRRETFYFILLPEVQETRSFARLLVARARWQIAHGKFDDALRTFQTANALARNVGQGPTVINGLVGNAIASMMFDQMELLVQQPDSPNLYWALTHLRYPLIDYRPGIDAETYALQMSIPLLGDVENMQKHPSEWRVALLELWKLLEQVDESQPKGDYSEVALDLRIKDGYPKARQALLEWGVPADQVESMPVEHVIVWYTMRTYNTLRDDVVKWTGMPYYQGQQECQQAYQRIVQGDATEEILPAARILLTPIANLRAAFARVERRVALLRTIEALRLHAAANDGKLPAALDEIALVPLPDDPVTGRPFLYKLDEGVARLQGPSLPGQPLSYELQMRTRLQVGR
jgi:hypothetical protein